MDVYLMVVHLVGVHLMGVDLTGVLRLIEVGATTIKGGCDDYPQGVRRITAPATFGPHLCILIFKTPVHHR
jgi:hypothetical protein